MALPTPSQLQMLTHYISQQQVHFHWFTVAAVKRALDAYSGAMMEHAGTGFGTAAKFGLTTGAAAAGISTGVALVSFGAVLAPWLAAADVARRSGDIMDLYTLKEHAEASATGGGTTGYVCRCGSCARNIDYVVKKKEMRVARVAIGVATLGASALPTVGYSLGKKYWSKARGEMRPKEATSRALVKSAREGCTTAIAAIFLLSGEWQWFRGGNAGIMRRAIAIIVSKNGWEVLQKQW